MPRDSTGQGGSAGTAAVILPGSTVGILGGGQLGRMIALEGRKMGYRFVTLDPTPDSPCGQVCDEQVVAPYDDLEAAATLAGRCDVITYEFENVDSEVVNVLESKGYVPQGSRLLKTTQNRALEKAALLELGVPVAPFAILSDRESLAGAIDRIGFPAVLKTTTGGYDGKGQWVIEGEQAAVQAFSSAESAHSDLILEQYIPFAKEISVIAARSPRGEVGTFPVVENIHYENMLHVSLAPARIPERIRARAEQLARKIVTGLAVHGLVAVEMFVTAEDELYVNELAPRPHNSGHLTLDACVTSQFEQHLRSICNWPLGSTELLTPAVMLNLIGDDVLRLREVIDRLIPEVKVHLYGKREALPKRKMGHLTVLGGSVERGLKLLEGLPFELHVSA